MTTEQSRERLALAIEAAGRLVGAFEVGDIDIVPFLTDLVDAVHDCQDIGLLDDSGALVDADWWNG